MDTFRRRQQGFLQPALKNLPVELHHKFYVLPQQDKELIQFQTPGSPTFCFYCKDIKPSYHSFMYSLVSLLSGIYPLPTMHSLLVKLYVAK